MCPSVHAHVFGRQDRPTGDDPLNKKLYEVAIHKYQLEVRLVDNAIDNLQIRETEARLGFPYSHIFAHEQSMNTTDGKSSSVDAQ